MSIEPLNFSNNKYELTGNEQNTVTQKKDTINNVMNPDNRMLKMNPTKQIAKQIKKKQNLMKEKNFLLKTAGKILKANYTKYCIKKKTTKRQTSYC